MNAIHAETIKLKIEYDQCWSSIAGAGPQCYKLWQASLQKEVALALVIQSLQNFATAKKSTAELSKRFLPKEWDENAEREKIRQMLSNISVNKLPTANPVVNQSTEEEKQ